MLPAHLHTIDIAGENAVLYMVRTDAAAEEPAA